MAKQLKKVSIRGIYSDAFLDIGNFTAWLQQNGAEILPPTNPYEVIRFKGKETGVIYTTGRHWGKYVLDTILAFAKGTAWDGRPTTTKRKSQGDKKKEALLKRDGGDCLLCGKPLGDDMTVDHLIPLTAGGTDLMQNKALMHRKCNDDCGHMPLNEKVKLAIKNRTK